MRRIRWKKDKHGTDKIAHIGSEDNKKESIKARQILSEFLAANPKGNAETGKNAHDFLIKRGISSQLAVETMRDFMQETIGQPQYTIRAMPKDWKTEEEIKVQKKFGADFWKKYSGGKTLHGVVKHFVKEHPNDKQHALREFALEVVGSGLIGKKLNEHNFASKKRKLVEIVQTEINKFDVIKSRPEKHMPEKKESQKVTIFDVDRLGGTEFEDFMAKLLQANGFTDVSVTGQAGDQGGDLLAKKMATN